MPAAKEKPTMLYRDSVFDSSALKSDSREIDLSFASEQPVERWDWENGVAYLEILDHSGAKSIDYSRLNNGGALLQNHDRTKQSGVVVRNSCKVDADKKSRCTVKFSRSPLGEQEFQDVKDGIRTLVSVGYQVGREISREKKDGVDVRRFEWEPNEISIVSIPADISVGVGREGSQVDFAKWLTGLTTEEREKFMKRILLDPAPAGTNREAAAPGAAAAPAAPAARLEVVDEGQVRQAALGKERSRIKEITTAGDLLAKDHPHCSEQIRTIVNESISGDVAVGDFQIRAMKEVLGAKPAKPMLMADLGLNEDEQRNYSILRGIQSCLRLDKRTPDGLEGEVHREIEKRMRDTSGYENGGFLVPSNAPVRIRRSNRERRMARDLNVTTFGQGGASVATNIVLPVIELLRNRMVCDRLGVQSMAGLTGNVAIPRQTGAATAYSLPESGTLTKSTQALDQLLLSPHRVGAWNDYTRQLLLQSSLDVENFIRDDLMKQIALKWDALILQGQGAGSEPTGIINTPGISSVVFGAAATYAKMVAFETLIAALNADAENMAYVTTPAVKGVLKAAAKLLVGATTVAANPIWDKGNYGDGSNDGEVNGYRAASTNQIANNLVLFGNFEDVIHGIYGGYDVIVNPYSRDTDAAVRITINTFGDVAVRHPASFTVSADAGNQ